MAIDRKAIKKHIRGILIALGDDPDREGLKDTPERVAKMYEEVFEGMNYSNKEIAEMFNKTFEQGLDTITDSKDMVLVKDIDIFSYCEHHLALMYDVKVSVAYIPNGKVIGLSKIARIADMVGKRLQLQEKIGSDIAEIMETVTESEDIAVYIEGCHSCMTARGIKKNNSKTVTTTFRGELLDQASDKLYQTTGLTTSLEKAESTSIGSCERVTVASVQTLSQEARLKKFKKDDFGVIVVDEAHHAMSKTYQRVLKYFDSAKVLGVTATPDRADQKNLGQFFDSKAYEYTLHQAVKEDYLCPVKAQMIPLELDIRNVGLSNGYYAVGEIGSSLEPYLNQIALEMLNYREPRRKSDKKKKKRPRDR